MLAFLDIHCPYCGESIEIAVDGSIDHQTYIEDCQVCCRPIKLTASVDEDGSPQVIARAENDA